MLKFVGVILLSSVAMYIGSQIHVPIPGLPVPLTLQTLFCILLPLVFGKPFASIGIGLFLVFGALGLPVFAGNSGGYEYFPGNSGGYLMGFLVASLLTWKVKSDKRLLRLAYVFLEFVILQLVILFGGALWISFGVPNWEILIGPFILPLLIKALLGTALLELTKSALFRKHSVQQL